MRRYYFLKTLDQWLHYNQQLVTYGYVFIIPITELLRVFASVLICWGQYTIVWKDLEERFDESQGKLWFSAKVAIFIVSLVSLFYVVLTFALVIMWAEFLSLNTIDDIATKRTNFEVAMAVAFTVFGLFTVGAATATICYKSKRADGSFAKVSYDYT